MFLTRSGGPSAGHVCCVKVAKWAQYKLSVMCSLPALVFSLKSEQGTFFFTKFLSSYLNGLHAIKACVWHSVRHVHCGATTRISIWWGLVTASYSLGIVSQNPFRVLFVFSLLSQFLTGILRSARSPVWGTLKWAYNVTVCFFLYCPSLAWSIPWGQASCRREGDPVTPRW